MERAPALQPGLFFMGREEVSSGFVAEFRRALDPLREMERRKMRSFRGSISARYGMHFAITGVGFVPLFRDGVRGESKLRADELVEVVEYDPVRHCIMAIGKAEPPLDSPLHWFAHRCFPQNRAFVRFAGDEDARPDGDIPRLDINPAVYDSGVCLKIMEALKEGHALALGDGSVLVTGADLPTACGSLLECLRSE
jgi:hypothetical protein